ncbi:LysR family transcriptional regulator [Pseudoclavibacter endophyticus]|uniref:LysR family transcriptional regulator n=1 Tax=Pseudoclavibacter endophyticus TaxID=1778590 RepID=A0A6H9WE39_9MICO|nr:LysR substrate-binding domain-containing protein [Pseudoclavibacter endophyticus]KAB1649222.1 LysR family transcriptional regulator [Pseudoclavibacter endophyticus]GGA64391.1 LysR family transcriptional regulator [Pseudoclavibacter endophyticus]
MSEITLRQLEYFVAIADAGSITGAAEACRVTQAAVSVALGQLEQRVGTRLVIRRPGHGVTLTSEGVAVAAHSRTVLDEVGKVSSIVAEVRGRLSGPLSIGVYRTLAQHTIPALIGWFSDRHPDVSLQFSEGSGGDVQHDLLAGRVQLAVIYRAQLIAGCSPTILREGRRMAAFSPEHPLATRARLTMRDLAEHPAIFLDEEPALQRTLAAFASEGVEPLVPWRGRSIEAILNVVGRGLAYSIVMQTRSHSPEGRPLHFRPFEGPDLDNPVAAALPDGVRPSALVSEALTAIREYWVATDAALAGA